MGTTVEDWEQWKNDIDANFNVAWPDELDDALVEGIQNLSQAKPTILMDTRIVGALVLKDGLSRVLQTEKNLIKNRIAWAKSAYEADHPEFDPNEWDNLTNEEMFAMCQPYDDVNPGGPYSRSLSGQYAHVYGVLDGKVRDATDRTTNILKKIVDVSAL